MAAASFSAQFCQVLLEDKGALTHDVLKLVDPSDLEKIVPAVARLFAARGCATDLVNRLIQVEIQETQTEATLFRRNSIASKGSTAVAILVGKEYLKDVLAGPLKALLDDPIGYEVDPVRLQKGQELKQCQDRLVAVATKVLDAIIAKASSCPPAVRRICNILATETKKKFPGSTHIVVGGFMFLRYFVPAITVPEGFGVLPGPMSAVQRRALILLGKLIQGLANGVEFGAKEDFLAPLNGFVTGNKAKMAAYLDTISAPVTGWREQAFVGDGKPLPVLDDDLDSLEKGVAEIIAAAGITGLSGHDFVGVDVIQDREGDPKDIEMLASAMTRLKIKIKDSPAGGSARAKLLISLLENKDEATAKGVSAGALHSRRGEHETGREVSPNDMKMEKDAQAKQTQLLNMINLKWEAVDEVGGVKICFRMEGIEGVPSDHVSIMGEVRVEGEPATVTNALRDVDARQKWDALFSGGHSVAHKVAANTRVLSVKCTEPACDFVVLERVSPSVVGMGGCVSIYSSDMHPMPGSASRGSLYPSGFIVRPVKADKPACYVSYILNVKFPGVSTDDAWGVAMTMVCSLAGFKTQLGQ
eukprot:CAMPEP_0114555048 /NCGR_PEP_ID=MMETSP0114-20121206/8540_1 /TAXON_ID=31324 /ORGANISM="Goniomonas sp, Strain m" /LENGTH=586 /DNA_ID=CAMNT_0001740145 /DNA_START=1 /DNA_END=1761 /DNA_ORIENTATION=+